MDHFKPHVAVVTRCRVIAEAITALNQFPALDDVHGVLVLLADFGIDDDLTRFADRKGAMLIYTGEEKSDCNLRKALTTFNTGIEYVAFWPRCGHFSRLAGLACAIVLLQETGVDFVSGLVRHDGNWSSGASVFHRRQQTLVTIPVELENVQWKKAGAHSTAKVDAGGSLLVTKLNDLPATLPLMAENIGWGLQFILANEQFGKTTTLLFTGFQTQTTLKTNECRYMNERDAAILHEFLKMHNLLEVVLFGTGKLVRDDDFCQADLQYHGLLDPEGNNKEGEMDINSFYRSVLNCNVIGPLYHIDNDANPLLVPSWELLEANKKLAIEVKKTKKASLHSINNTRTIDIFFFLMRRIINKLLLK